MNRDTELLYYNQRLIIDAPVLTEPRAWKISKINRVSPVGICHLTFAQDRFDQHHDYIEVDDNGNVIGMWADYFNDIVEPADKIPVQTENDYYQITFSGLKPELKIGGNYKKFAGQFEGGTWHFSIDNSDATDLLNVAYEDATHIKIKFIGDNTYIGSILKIEYSSDENQSELLVAIVGL